MDHLPTQMIVKGVVNGIQKETVGCLPNNVETLLFLSYNYFESSGSFHKYRTILYIMMSIVNYYDLLTFRQTFVLVPFWTPLGFQIPVACKSSCN